MRKIGPSVKSNVTVVIASATPAAPQSAPEISQVTSVIRSVRMPQLRATTGFAEVARIARPSWVRVSSRCSASIATTVIPMMISWLAVTTKPPAWMVLPACWP